jgi:hypothetical protein
MFGGALCWRPCALFAGDEIYFVRPVLDNVPLAARKIPKYYPPSRQRFGLGLDGYGIHSGLVRGSAPSRQERSARPNLAARFLSLSRSSRGVRCVSDA